MYLLCNTLWDKGEKRHWEMESKIKNGSIDQNEWGGCWKDIRGWTNIYKIWMHWFYKIQPTRKLKQPIPAQMVNQARLILSWVPHFLLEGEYSQHPASLSVLLSPKAGSVAALGTEPSVCSCPSQTISSRGAPINLKMTRWHENKKETLWKRANLVNKQESAISINRGAKVIEES